MDRFTQEFFSFNMNGFNSDYSASQVPFDSYRNRFAESGDQHQGNLDNRSSPAFEGTSPGSNDSFNATLKFISEVLLEEEEQQHDLDRFNDSLPQQPAEKPFYGSVSQNYPGESNTHDSIYQFKAKNYRVNNFPNQQRGKKKGYREMGSDPQEEEGRRNKQLAFYAGDYAPTEMFERVLLWDGDNDDEDSLAQTLHSINQSNNKEEEEEETVDLLTLLNQCAHAVESNDGASSTRLVLKIRQQSSSTGQSTQRLAHYLANALEARLTRANTQPFSPIVTDGMTSADVLKAYQLHITTCPFFRMSFCYANSAIRKLATAASNIHIVDFGILYGFQWPGLIQRLSQRPGGPPTLRITGIELPQPGFRPSEHLDETKRRLHNYCLRFGVPAELNMISRKWETIRYEDLGVREGEIVIVNCMNRMRHVSDEGGARDAVLSLIRKINPELFIHGVVNGAYNAASFMARFGEAVGHFAGLFDMMEATVGCGDPHGVMFERAVYGRYVENVVACDGAARVERPERYRDWELRNRNAGFRQVPLDEVIFDAVKKTVGTSYHKDFSVERDGEWLVQGWRGRSLYALTCWKPV